MNQLAKWNVKVLIVAHLSTPVHSLQKVHSIHVRNFAGDLCACPRWSWIKQTATENGRESPEVIRKTPEFLDVSTRLTKKRYQQPKTNNQPTTTTKPTSFFQKNLQNQNPWNSKEIVPFFMEAGSVVVGKTRGNFTKRGGFLLERKAFFHWYCG